MMRMTSDVVSAAGLSGLVGLYSSVVVATDPISVPLTLANYGAAGVFALVMFLLFQQQQKENRQITDRFQAQLGAIVDRFHASLIAEHETAAKLVETLRAQVCGDHVRCHAEHARLIELLERVEKQLED